MCSRENNLSRLIGRTPLIRLLSIEKHFDLKSEIYAKLEMYNPTRSVKDRAAYFILNDALERGIIAKDCMVVEPTSGNMGISLAMMSSIFGYKATIVMPDNMSSERISLIRAYGGRVLLSSGEGGMGGAIDLANEIHRENQDSILLSQFTNPQNVEAHYRTTGPEIYRELNGAIDFFACGVGTGGTIGGVGRFLKERIDGVKIVAVEPSRSAVLSGNPAATHKIQGIGAGFVPPLLDRKVIDIISTVEDEMAIMYSRILVEREGILAGISSGAVLFAAIEIAKKPENKGKKIVTLFADGGEKYLSLVC